MWRCYFGASISTKFFNRPFVPFINKNKTLLSFVAGLITGAIVILLIIGTPSNNKHNEGWNLWRWKNSSVLLDWFSSSSNRFLIRSLTNSSVAPVEPRRSDYYIGKRSLAAELAREVRIFCWISTKPDFHETRAIHVARTWARRCNTFVFVSSQNDTSLPAIDLMGNMPDDRAHLWAKTKAAFRYAYAHHFDDHDWFLKADDDTYIVVENLRQFLRYKSADKDALYFGHRFAPFVEHGYMGGGSGYVLSKLALQTLVLNGINENESAKNGSKKGVCNLGDGEFEDVELGQCMAKLGIQPSDTRDSAGRHRFLPFGPLKHFGPERVVLPSYQFYPLGPECCSNNLISFHYVNPTMMQFLDYAFYAVKPFGHEYEEFLSTSMSTTNTMRV